MGLLSNTTFLWGAAAATFGLGDIVTTHYGLQQAGVEEAHPLSDLVLGVGGTPAMIAVKVVVFAVALYAAGNVVPRDWAVGIPVGLLMLGTVIVANNVNVLARA